MITISTDNGDLVIRLNYNNTCVVDKTVVNSNEVISDGNMVFSGICVNDRILSSKESLLLPRISINKNTVNISNIKYGNHLGKYISDMYGIIRFDCHKNSELIQLEIILL